MYQSPELTLRLRALWHTLRTKWLSLSLLCAFVWVMVPLVGGVQTATVELEAAKARLTTLTEMSTVRIQSEDKTRAQIAEIREDLRAAVENIGFLKERLARLEESRGLEIGRGADANAFIELELNKLMNQFGAKRAYVFQKHDGRTSPGTGAHLWFYSMTHEVVAPGVSREATAYQTLPESLFLRWDSALEKRRIVEDPAADAMEPNGGNEEDWLRRTMAERGVRKVVAVPLFSSSGTMPEGGTLIGFVGLDFDRIDLNINMPFMRPFLYRAAVAIMGALLK